MTGCKKFTITNLPSVFYFNYLWQVDKKLLKFGQYWFLLSLFG